MNLFTIGFTKTTAENFFSRLRAADVKKVLDVRLRADSQLSGFAKQKDLKFFLNEIIGVGYQHVPDLAPNDEILDAYKKRKMSWDNYEREYRSLISSRGIERILSPDILDGACLLCSEALPHRCHRRVAAEYLSDTFGISFGIRHL